MESFLGLAHFDKGGGAMEGSASKSRTPRELATDPVCHMRVNPSKTDLVADYHGGRYYFCADACRKAFEANPDNYLDPKPTKVRKAKGWWGRYLERVGRANKELFGGGPPRCCH
jgi:YHS domain-containing protein